MRPEGSTTPRCPCARCRGCARTDAPWAPARADSPRPRADGARTRRRRPSRLPAEVTREELADAPVRVRVGRRVEADGGAAALAGLRVAVLDLGQEHARLALDVEIVDGTRIDDERDVGALGALLDRQLLALGGVRPVVVGS